MPVVYNGAPTVFENLVIVGSNSPPGSVRAFDARSGAWRGCSTPCRCRASPATTPGRATRGAIARACSLGRSRSRSTSIARCCTPRSRARSRRRLRWRSPGRHAVRQLRGGARCTQGVRRWHFQTVHHDLWNYDLPAAPTLVDVAIDGDVVPLLAAPAKSGYLYILNRVTGEPVFGIEERPVPGSDVPGERSAATQPVPVKPPPLARVAYSAADLVSADDTTPEHAAFCKALVERSGGLRTPDRSRRTAIVRRARGPRRAERVRRRRRAHRTRRAARRSCSRARSAARAGAARPPTRSPGCCS